MKPPKRSRLKSHLAEQLAWLLDLSLEEVKVEKLDGSVLFVKAGKWNFVVDFSAKGDTAAVSRSLERLRECKTRSKGNLLTVAPYMGDVGRKLCEDTNVSWMDLSGNAHIVGKNLRIRIEGQENKFRRLGRHSNLFAAKSARVTRCMLIEPQRLFLQKELVELTGLSQSLTSKTLNGLHNEGLLERDEHKRYKVTDPFLLLEAWSERYDFFKHSILRGHIAARSGLELFNTIAASFENSNVGYAATALGAAWLMTNYANFRLVTFYLKEYPTQELLSSIGFQEGPRGANTWLVVPDDEGVFCGSVATQGVKCVHPVQTYLDLLAHPERAKDAADQLRHLELNWRVNG